MRQKLPSLKIPPPLKGADEDSFAHDTIVRRLPDIARRILKENAFSADIIEALQALIGELPNGKIRMLTDAGPAYETWQQTIASYTNQNWLDVPWFFAETYFYRRILEATGYFRSGSGQDQDPFSYQKQLGLEMSKTQIQALSSQLQGWVSGGWKPERFARLLAIDLWGNQLDLSLWPADSNRKPDHSGVDQQSAHLLVDNSDLVVRHFAHGKRPMRVEFLIDNAGFELVCDLCLADFLLSTQAAAIIVFHLKAHPTFVSDAMIVDVTQTLEFLASDAQPETRSLAARLEHHRANGRLRLTQHAFWTSPLDAWEMPIGLRQELSSAQLVISKGDANYRRLLGDRHWNYTVPFADVLSYFPTSLVSLRTLKSEVVVGLSADQIEAMNQKDVQWMTNGRWGTIQFAENR